jgi:hypothetical protein
MLEPMDPPRQNHRPRLCIEAGFQNRNRKERKGRKEKCHPMLELAFAVLMAD